MSVARNPNGGSRQPARPHVVTIGGGHGQAAVLKALCKLQCQISAIVSVADDGGCSGKLRQELHMPPPGDLRRCLSTLARDRELAERFEVRLDSGEQKRRSAGNLALSAAYQEYGSLQKAVDWAADVLRCRGRVIPVAETAGRLVVYDQAGGILEGETNVEAQSGAPMAAMVHGPTVANPAATEALKAADWVLIGPGSFFTSTLATLTTAEFAKDLAACVAPKLFLANLVPEGRQTEGYGTDDYARILQDHLTIASGGEPIPFDVLEHRPRVEAPEKRADGSLCFRMPVALAGEQRHHSELLAEALSAICRLESRRPGPLSAMPPPGDGRDVHFEQHLASGKRLVAPGEEQGAAGSPAPANQDSDLSSETKRRA